MAFRILTVIALAVPMTAQAAWGGGYQSDPHKWIMFEFFMMPDCTEDVNATFYVPEDYCMLGNFSRGEEGELGRIMTWHRWTCNGTHVEHHEWVGTSDSDVGRSGNSPVTGETYCRTGNLGQRLTRTPFHSATSNYTIPNNGVRFCAHPGASSDAPTATHWNITCDLETKTPTAAEPDLGMWMGNCSQEGSGTNAVYHCGYDGTGEVAGVVHNPIDCSYATNGTHQLYGPNNAAKMKYSSVCIPSGWLSGSYMVKPAVTVLALLLAALRA